MELTLAAASAAASAAALASAAAFTAARWASVAAFAAACLSWDLVIGLVPVGGAGAGLAVLPLMAGPSLGMLAALVPCPGSWMGLLG